MLGSLVGFGNVEWNGGKVVVILVWLDVGSYIRIVFWFSTFWIGEMIFW